MSLEQGVAQSQMSIAFMIFKKIILKLELRKFFKTDFLPKLNYFNAAIKIAYLYKGVLVEFRAIGFSYLIVSDVYVIKK